jgi:hypothetical protein
VGELMVSPTHFTYWVGGRPPRPPRIGALGAEPNLSDRINILDVFKMTK